MSPEPQRIRAWLPLVVVLAGAAHPSGRALFERHLEAIGGEAALRALPGLVLGGTLTLVDDGIVAPYEERHSADGRYLSHAELPTGVVLEEGVVGDVVWLRDPALRLPQGDERAELLRAADLFADADSDRWYAALDNRGRGPFAGVRAWEVGVQPREGRARSDWFDQRTGLRLGSVTPNETFTAEGEPGIPVRLTVADWAEVAGVRVASRISVQSESGTHEVRFDRLEARDPGPMEVPADLRAWLDDARVVEVPFERYHGLVEVSVSVGEVAMPMFLDTGANFGVIAAESEAALGLEPGGYGMPVWAMGGDLEGVRIRQLPDFQVGGQPYPSLSVMVLPESFAEGRGILGADFCSLLRVEILPEHSQVRLHGLAAPPPALDGLVKVPMESFAGGLLRVQARLGDGRSFPMLVDLGAGTTVVNWPAANTVGLVPGMRGLLSLGSVVGADGRPMPIAGARMERLSLGDFALGRAVVGIANIPALRRAFPEGPAGILGVDVLAGRHVVIDAAGGALYLAPD